MARGEYIYDDPEEAYREAVRRIEEAAGENTTKLNLSRLGLAGLPPEIGQLPKLKELRLGYNQLTSVPVDLSQLTKLQTLDLTSNKITDLPTQIGQLTNLQLLLLSHNNLASLPAEIDQLIELKRLILWDNQLSILPPEIGQLTKLKVLDLDKNQLTSLPAVIGQLPVLKTLRLKHNQLISLHAEIRKLKRLKTLDLNDNPLPIPPEILKNVDDPQAILTYYFETREAEERGEVRALMETKLVVVGQGSVGKTSLVNRLVHETYKKGEGKTRGIDLTEWSVKSGKEQVKVNIWDFGGQEIMHATHQFFLTKRSLYLLVLDARLEEAENRLDYWLRIIEAFGGDSPIIIVGNKIDEQPLDLDERGLLLKNPNIKAIIATSAETNEGIDRLRNALEKEIATLEHIQDKLPNNWFHIKEGLEAMQHDTHDEEARQYISYERYVEMCEAAGVKDSASQETLIGFLHDLGVVLNFRDDPDMLLEETNVLNPEWVTNGVYQILNDKNLIHKGGIFTNRDIARVLTAPDYPKAIQRGFIMDLMERFELSYSWGSGRNKKFLVPDLLPKEEVYSGKWKGAQIFEYHYDVLPSSLLSRFMVRRSTQVVPNRNWRTGVLLKKDSVEALVTADRGDRVIRMRVKGNRASRQEYLSILRDEMDEINATLPNLEVKQYIPVPDQEGVLVDYQYLIDNLADGINVVRPPGSEKKVDIRELLEDYYRENEKQSDQQPEGGERRRANPTPPDKPTVSNRDLLITAGAVFFIVVVVIGAIFVLNSMQAGMGTISLAVTIVVIASALALFLVDRLSEGGLIQILQNFKSGGKPPEE